MFVYYLCFFVIWIFSFYKKKPENHKAYCIGITVLLCCLMGFRSETLGMNDVQYIYIPMFNRIKEMSFSEVLTIYPAYRGNLIAIFTKLFTLICDNQYIWLICVSIPFVIAAGKLIYEDSEYPAMSFFMLFGTHIYLVNMFLIRHSIAMAILICSFSFIKQRKPIKFILTVILAGMFHTTAFVFLIAYPVAIMRFNWKIYVITLVGSFVIIRYNSMFFDLLFTYMDNEYYSNYVRSSGSKLLTYFYISLLILICIIVCRWFSKKKTLEKKEEMYFNITCLSVVTMGFTSVVVDFYRIGMFFGIYGVILLPNLIRSIKDVRIRLIISAALILVLGIFAVSGIQDAGLAPYKTWLIAS